MRTEGELRDLAGLEEPSIDHAIHEQVGPGEPPARSQWELFRRRFFKHRLAIFGLVVLVLLGIGCFGASVFAPYEKNEQDLLLGATAPSADHWFGTDQLGRDYFTEVLYAGQLSLKIGLGVALVSTIVGTTIGAIAGFFGRWAEQVLMRVTDLFLVVPGIAVLAVALKRFDNYSVLGLVDLSATNVIILVLAGLGWMYVARIVRGQVMSIKEKEFVEAARASGASSIRIVMRYILPNCVGPIVVNATLGIAAAIVTESTLSYLGLGVQKPTTSWGNMLADASGNVEFDTHLLYFPGIAILLTVLCVNFVGDGLRDAFDPQAKH